MTTKPSPDELVERMIADILAVYHTTRLADCPAPLHIRTKLGARLLKQIAAIAAMPELTELQQRVKQLEEGLKPFAREADNWLDKMDCEDLPADATDIKISDLRRARSLLQGMDK